METKKLTLFTTFLSTLTRKSSAVFGLLLLVSGATLFFSPQTAHAFDLDTTQTGTTVTLSPTGLSTLDSFMTAHALTTTNTTFYFLGSYNNDGSTNDWSWGGSYNGILGGRDGAGVLSFGSIDVSNIPSGGGHIGGQDDLYMCFEFELHFGSFIFWSSHGITDYPCIHFTWSAMHGRYDAHVGTPPPPADTSTHIASTTPADLQNTATSTNYFFGVEGVINSADTGSNMNVTMQYYNDTFAQTAVSPSVVSHYITFPLTGTTTQSFSFSTTTDMSTAYLGRYYLITTINKDEFSLFGFSFWSTAIATKVTTFYVSTTTAHIYVTGYDAIADTSNSANITAIEAGITTCDFSWGDLASTTKISSFLTCLVVPDSTSLAITFGQFQKNVLTLAPWGYITRFVSILASTTPVEPPPLTYKFGSSSPAVLQAYTASDPITFQVFDYMGSSSPLLQIRADDGSNKNVWDIIDPFITFLVTLGVLLVILGDIMGFQLPTGESENERMKKIDYSKMSDKEFQKKVKIEYVTEEEQRMQRRNRL